jgi:predicted dehydrogenase
MRLAKHMPENVNRRDFMRTAAAAGAVGATGNLFARSAKSAGRVLGANDKINLAIIGVGGRGQYLARQFSDHGARTGACQIVAVADVYAKRKNETAKQYQCDGYLDYREIINRSDVDAVVVATPDHWHARMALESMDRGKDVYLEKPMCHTIEEAKQLAATVRETRRVLQVGSQTTSADQWHKAKKYIADGAIGDMLMSQGSYHRNSTYGEWNGPGWAIDPDAGPNGKDDNYIDWKMWLGSAPKRPYDADRFFRFRKYWDYSGGIATDLFFHVVAPLNICWPEPQFPKRVSAMGGIYEFKDEREVPDTFTLIADFPRGHSLVLSSSMANSQHVPGTIRGHLGTIVMVDHGRFEAPTQAITLIPERRTITAEYKAKFGETEQKIAVEQSDAMVTHIANFLDCMRSRQQPTLDVETGLRAQVTISMAVESYRRGAVMYWDERAMKATTKPPRA